MNPGFTTPDENPQRESYIAEHHSLNSAGQEIHSDPHFPEPDTLPVPFYLRHLDEHCVPTFSISYVRIEKITKCVGVSH